MKLKPYLTSHTFSHTFPQFPRTTAEQVENLPQKPFVSLSNVQCDLNNLLAYFFGGKRFPQEIFFNQFFSNLTKKLTFRKMSLCQKCTRFFCLFQKSRKYLYLGWSKHFFPLDLLISQNCVLFWKSYFFSPTSISLSNVQED